jgi:thiol:disulfide interchange protein DsbA
MRFLKIAALALAGLFTAACSAATDTGPYELGKQYSQVRSVQKPVDPQRITVEEFFWYGCPHCFHLDPELNAWLAKKPADVDFTRVPNTLGRPEGEVHARAFYIAQTLGISDKIHKPLFDAIQVQMLPMNSLESIRALFVQVAGIKPAEFDQAAGSFLVEGRLQQAASLGKDYGITGVPTIVVGGEYMIGGQTDQMKVVDYVVDKVRKERKR